MSMSNYFRIPKIQLVLTLLAILISSCIFFHSLVALYSLALTSAVTICADMLFLSIRKKPFFLPSAALVTACIITLLIPPTSNWLEFVIAGIIAMMSKNFLRIGRHIFNPAAIGIIFSSFMFNHPVSWWAVSWQTTSLIGLLILFIPGYVSIMRMRRFFVIASFLGTYIVINLFMNHNSLFINRLFDPTFLFFSFVMLPEPMTNPSKLSLQIISGLTVAVFSFFSPFTNLDPLMLSLLVSNLLFFRLR